MQRLESHDVHLWRVATTIPPVLYRTFWSTLSEAEKAQATRFRFDHLRTRYVASQGWLRELLGRYAGVPPERVTFRAGPRGKPSLAVEPGQAAMEPTLEFNLSHSGDLAVAAFSLGRAVGVDVEQIRPEVAADSIPERYFTPEEQAGLARLPETDRIQGFFACWTRKEAYMKGRGEGLHLGLDTFEVSVDPNGPAALVRSDKYPGDPSTWSIQDFDPGPGYRGAVAVEGRDVRLVAFAEPPAPPPREGFE